MNSVVYVVHCVDTEGPLKESINDTFKRIEEIWKITLEPNKENLQRLQNKEINLGGYENAIAELVAPHLLNYNDSWKKLNHMLEDITNNKFRRQLLDSFGNGWIYSWFCVDHVGYEFNPRKRELGFHKIFDRYVELTKSKESSAIRV